MTPAPPPTASPPGTRGLRVMLGICTAILVVGALYLARAVFAPLAFALFVIAIVWPLQASLQRVLPKGLALALTMAATIVGLGAFGWVIVWGFSHVSRYVVAEAARFEAVYEETANWLEAHGIALNGLWVEHFNAASALRVLQHVSSVLNATLTFSVVVLIYVILGLLETDATARKLATLPGEGGRVLRTGGARTAAKLRRYMLVRTQMSVVTGVLTGLFILACGLPLATEWGVIAFALNYVPFIGPLVATVLPSLFAAVQLHSWQDALLVFATLQVIQNTVGSYLEPLVAGTVLSMSPFLVLVSVFFWTFLWGIAGAFIGIPIVLAILTLCDEHEPSRWIASLLGVPDAKAQPAGAGVDGGGQ